MPGINLVVNYFLSYTHNLCLLDLLLFGNPISPYDTSVKENCLCLQRPVPSIFLLISFTDQKVIVHCTAFLSTAFLALHVVFFGSSFGTENSRLILVLTLWMRLRLAVSGKADFFTLSNQQLASSCMWKGLNCRALL